MGNCTFRSCGRDTHAVGLCWKHYRRQLDGRPMADRYYEYEFQPEKCWIPECPDPPYCRGWCKRHYNRWYVYGDPLGGGPNKPNRRRSRGPE